MLKLSGKILGVENFLSESGPGSIFKLISNEVDRLELLPQDAFLVSNEGTIPENCAVYLILKCNINLCNLLPKNSPVVYLEDDFKYLGVGDVVRVSIEDMKIRTLYRKVSNQNHFLVTERCDNYCLMCSQPPKSQNDDWVIEEILKVLPLIDPNTKELGFTGGEPTLLGKRFIEVLHSCKDILPNTGIHVLSNGRKFSDIEFAKDWANINHPDLMVGIPVYSDLSTVHDYVVQADSAYDQTIRGILNLKRLQQRVEIRVVLHKQTISSLIRLAEFISRNLLFVDHVALMGLEIMGFTRANLDSLWIDPVDYQKELLEAVQILDSNKLKVSIYNLPLCLLDRKLWSFAVQSISDWKNEYLPQCGSCDVRNKCAGFFWSAQFKNSGSIYPIINRSVVSL